MHFQIHPEVERAQTIDKAFYLDPAVFEATRERVFARSWQWLGLLDDIDEPGSLAPRTLLPGLLDEPLLLARDEAGELRCLSNVCTHRGNVLVHEACRANQIRCGYHSRRFDLAGRMSFMPGFEGACDFPSAADHLPQLPLQHAGGLAFTSLRPALCDFDAWFGPVAHGIPWLPAGGWPADPTRSREFTFDAHWALYVENYLEGLHIPFVHPALNRNLDMNGYTYRLAPWAVLQRARAGDGEAAFDVLDGGERIAAYYWWLFPNLMLNFYPWGLSLNLVLPLGPAKTRVLFRSFVADASRLGAGAGGALDPVEMEDEAVVLTVQRGIRSRLYTRGRYSPRHECGVHHFHRLLAAALQNDAR